MEWIVEVKRDGQWLWKKRAFEINYLRESGWGFEADWAKLVRELNATNGEVFKSRFLQLENCFLKFHWEDYFSDNMDSFSFEQLKQWLHWQADRRTKMYHDRCTTPGSVSANENLMW